MVSSRTPAQGRHSSPASSMWAVVVLGIITAVFAWVWFGGRGSDKKRSETQEEEQDTPVTAESQQRSGTSQHEKSHSAGITPGEASLPNLNQEDRELRGGHIQCKDDHHEMEEQEPEVVTSTAHKQIPLAESKPFPVEDLHHFSVPEKEVVQISQDTLKTTAKEDLVKTQVEVNHSTGLEEQRVQVKEDVSTSLKELAGAKEEVGEVTVEDLKPVTKEEKLEQASKETNKLIVPEKVVPISSEHLAPVQGDVMKLLNGNEEQKENETVNPEDNVANNNALKVTVPPKQVNRSSSKNTFDLDQLESYGQSESDYSGEKQSATLQSSADVQGNGHIVQTNNLLSDTSIPTKSEDVVLASPAVDKCDVLLHSSSQEEESHREATLHDLDSHRTKRVAAVQPIPQNVSLEFKVHYITQSESQMIAVTGDHEKLGEWENYVPLNSDKDGYWSHSVTLPADANVEWKFVMVENGKIKRWEECNNRHVRTAHEEITTQQWWGYP